MLKEDVKKDKLKIWLVDRGEMILMKAETYMKVKDTKRLIEFLMDFKGKGRKIFVINSKFKLLGMNNLK